MKEKLDLSTRHLTFTEFNGMQARTTVTEDGYRIRFIENPLPSIKGLTFKEKYKISNITNQENGFVISYRGNKNIFVGTYVKTIRRIGNRVFPCTSWLYAIRYDGKRIIKPHCSIHDRIDIARFIFHYFGIECILDTYHSDFELATLLGSKTVLKAIFQQKVTNAHDITRVYVQTFTGIRTMPSYETVSEFIHMAHYYEPGLVDLAYFTTSFEKSMRLVIDACKDDRHITELTKRYNIFKDLVLDAVKLDIKVNPDWSLKRMQEEHQKNTEQIMLEMEQGLSDDPLYKTPTAIDGKEIQGTVLSTEKQVFREASLMHHCLYNHYYYRINNGRYIALSLEVPERCTVGIFLGHGEDPKDEKAVLEQIHTIYNGSVSRKSRAIIANFIAEQNSRLTALMKQARRRFEALTGGKNDEPKTEYEPLAPAEDFGYEDDIPF